MKTTLTVSFLCTLSLSIAAYGDDLKNIDAFRDAATKANSVLTVPDWEQTPEAVAVTFEDKPLTYRGLNERANLLAHHLRQRGVGPEVLVGLYMERSLDMVIGLLGILKAGGAYVPLDPAYPVERLGFMVKDSQAALLLSQARVRLDIRRMCPYSSAVLGSAGGGGAGKGECQIVCVSGCGGH